MLSCFTLTSFISVSLIFLIYSHFNHFNMFNYFIVLMCKHRPIEKFQCWNILPKTAVPTITGRYIDCFFCQYNINGLLIDTTEVGIDVMAAAPFLYRCKWAYSDREMGQSHGVGHIELLLLLICNSKTKFHHIAI